MRSGDSVERLAQSWSGQTTEFAERLDLLASDWEHENGRTLCPRVLVELLAETGCAVSYTYASQLLDGQRGVPTPRVMWALTSVFGVSSCRFDYEVCPSGTDLDLADRMSDPALRRLLKVADGLSSDSLSLLVDMAGRLRSVEGRLMTTEY